MPILNIPWNALHPLVIHFPIALLLVAPVFVVLAIAVKSHRQAFALAALLLMLLGTASAYIAVETGESTARAATIPEAARPVLHDHEELAELVRLVFTILTAAFAAILFFPAIKKTWAPKWPFAVLSVLFLACYVAGMGVLTVAADHGGRLVHEYGIRAPITGSAVPETPEED